MATLTPTNTATNDQQTTYKFVSTATADTFVLAIPKVKKLAIQCDGLSADTLVFGLTTDPDATVFYNLFDDFGANPFAAPATKNTIYEKDISLYQFIKCTRTGVADGTINIFATVGGY